MLKKLTVFLICLLLMIDTFSASAEGAKLNLSAKSAVLMDYETGEVLYSLNPHERLSPASVTKIMPMLIIMEEIKSGRLGFEDMVTGSNRAKSMGGSTIFLDEGETLSVHDMLKGIAVASGNDATVAMAEHISGTVEEFVVKMNNRAKELGMENTNFVTCNGLDAEGHYSSAYDIALMSRELMKHDEIFRYTTIWMDSLRDGKFTLSNTNKLIRFYDGATGLKTGSTSLAKNCISATAKRDGMHLIAVVMAAPTSKERFADASALLNYGFATYKINTFKKAGDNAGAIRVCKGDKKECVLKYKSGFSYLSKKSENIDIEEKVLIQDHINAPANAGDVVGKVEFFVGEKQLGSSEIILGENIKKITFIDTFRTVLRSFAGVR